jgi:hypothetical protein
VNDDDDDDDDEDAPGTKMSATTTMRKCAGDATVETSAMAMTTIRVSSRSAAGGFDDGPADPAII